jgi:hypothetical protein
MYEEYGSWFRGKQGQRIPAAEQLAGQESVLSFRAQIGGLANSSSSHGVVRSRATLDLQMVDVRSRKSSSFKLSTEHMQNWKTSEEN